MLARLIPSIGTVGNALNNALAETTIGLYKTECTREGSPFRRGPSHTLADPENITFGGVHWFNTSRLMHRLGRRPPAEAEAEYYAHHQIGEDRSQVMCRKPGSFQPHIHGRSSIGLDERPGASDSPMSVTYALGRHRRS